MINSIGEMKDVKDISVKLTRENKKYVIAVANALLFSQGMAERSAKAPGQAVCLRSRP